MANVCPTPLHICRLRVTKLDSVGNVSSDDDNSWVTDKVISLAPTPELQSGEDRTLQGGCECIIASVRTPDRLKRFTFELVLGALEPGLFSLLIGATVMADGADDIGFDWPDQIDCSFVEQLVAIEAWGDAYTGDAPDPVRPYFYALWPASQWEPAQTTFQNDFAPFTFNGFSRTNSQWGDGPYGDVDLPASPGIRGGIYQVASAPPTAACDFATVEPSS